MKTTIALRICHHAISAFIVIARLHSPLSTLHTEIVIVDKIIARIIGRINVDHLDLAQIGFLQELQHFQIVALDVEVLAVKATGCTVLANTISHHRTQRCRDGCVCRQHRLFLVRPCELIALLPALYNGVGKLLPQNVKVNGVFYFAIAFHLGNCIGE